MELRFISADDIRDLLTYPACIEVVEKAMVATSNRNVALPLRHGMPLPNEKGMFGMMYGYLGDPESFGIKLVSLFPGNSQAGLPSHLGFMILYEAEHGKPLAIMDGNVITAIRTAAASAVATRHLARKDANTLAIIGSGEQAHTHIQAIPCVRDIKSIRVWGRTPAHVDALIKECRALVKADISAADSVALAVDGANIVCTVTSAPEPVVQGDWISSGTHLNVVGSSFPHTAEIDTALVAKSKFFIDYRESTLAQAGEFLRAVESGTIDESHILAEIGEVIAAGKPGRQGDDDITLYKSLGVAAQDLAAAHYVWQQAESGGRGQLVTL